MEQDRDDRARDGAGRAAGVRRTERARAEQLLALDEPAHDELPDSAVGLTDRERAVLAFERQWWKVPGSKERAIREHFDLSATRYYQLLNALVDRDDVVRHDPMLVKRLRRARAERVRGRTVRRLGLGRPD